MSYSPVQNAIEEIFSTTILSTKYMVIPVDKLPTLTTAGRRRFSHESVGVENLSTAAIQASHLLALQSRDITAHIGLDYDRCTLETSLSALEVDDLHFANTSRVKMAHVLHCTPDRLIFMGGDADGSGVVA